MKASGDLDKSGLGYTLTRLVNREEPVQLTVKSPEKQFTLFITEQGMRLDRLVGGGFASDLEDYLVQDNLISEVDLLRILSERYLSQKSTEEILLSQGFLQEGDLAQLKRRQIEDELLWMLSLTKGKYALEAMPPKVAEENRDPELPNTFFDLENLTAAALDRMQRYYGISKDFRNEREYFFAEPRVLEEKLLSLPDGPEKNVLSALKGDKPLNDVAETLELPTFKIFGIVSKYMVEGLVRPLTIEELRQKGKAALESEELITALGYLQRAFERRREDPEVVEELASMFEFAGEKAMASAFQEFLAALQVKRGDMAAAEEAWEKAASLDPNNFRVLERLFYRRMESGSRNKALETGLQFVTRALENNATQDAAEILSILRKEDPGNFALRRKAFEVRVQERDIPGAMAEVAEAERAMAGAGKGEFDPHFLPYAYQTLTRLDPGNPDILAKFEAAKKQLEETKKPSRLPQIAVLVILLGGLGAAGYFFVLHFDLLNPSGSPTQGGGGQATKKGPARDPKARLRMKLIEEGRGLSASDELENALAKFEEALKITPPGAPLRKEIQKEIDDLKKAIVARDEKRIAGTLEACGKRIDAAREAGTGGDEKAVEKAKETIREAETELKNLAKSCPESLKETLGQKEAAVVSALKALDERLAQVFYLRGALEWNQPQPDSVAARGHFKKSIEIVGDRGFGRKSKRMVDVIDRYLKDASATYQKGKSSLHRARKGAPSQRQTHLTRALEYLRTVVEEYSKAPVALQVEYPVWVETVPPGSMLRVEGKVEPVAAPALLMYDPAKGLMITAKRAGFNPAKAKANGTLARLRLELERGFLWRMATDENIDRGPAGDGERMFFGCRDGGLYAYDTSGLEKPKIAWPSFRVRDIGGIKTTPLSWAGKVVFCSANLGELWALDAISGRRAWGPLRFERMAEHTPAGLAKSPFLLVGDIGGTLYAVNGNTGALAWKVQATKPGEGIRSTPVIDQTRGVAFAGTTKGGLLKVSLKDGAGIWRVPTGLGASVQPALVGDRVLAVVGSRLFIYDALSSEVPKKPLWTTGGFYDFASPAVTRGSIHLTDRNGTYRIIRARDGNEILSISFGVSGKEPVTPLPVGDRVVLASGSKLSVWRIEGARAHRLWQVDVEGTINNPVIAQQGKVLFTTAEGSYGAVLLD
ncbi:MAG: outer membrane protein assembly factor BamB family protein [Planctomycetota bacterium]|jgi:outer membrane protein assembly factor BamB/tetratricopeptide (TPR) repeat protein